MKAAPGHQAVFELFTIFSPPPLHHHLEGEFFSFWFQKALQEMI